MNQTSVRKGFILKLTGALLLFSIMYSCKKEGQSTSEQTVASELAQKPKVDESAAVVHAWYKFIAKLQRGFNPQPVVLQNYRNFGFVGVALYEAVQPGIQTAKSLSEVLYQMPEIPAPDKHKEYLWGESANAALSSMFKQILTGLSAGNIASIDSMENVQYNLFKLATPVDVLNRSRDFGRSVATIIYNWSTTDNFNLSATGYTPPVCPSCWVSTATPPVAPVGPFLKDSRPFLESSKTALAPPIPAYYAYSENVSSGFYKAVKDVYDVGVALTNEQRNIANWWADAGGPNVGLPAPYHLLSIVTSVLEGQDANLWKAAEVYAKTGIAVKDGPIITFRSKYHYNLLRPFTYIRLHIDGAWNSFLPSPPYPDYTSGLMSNYAPVIEILIKQFGDIAFTDDAYGWRGLAPRVYPSLSKLSEEAALSRVYAGIHYRFTQYISIDMGKELGDKIDALHKIGPNH